jgi:hypothetical protein
MGGSTAHEAAGVPCCCLYHFDGYSTSSSRRSCTAIYSRRYSPGGRIIGTILSKLGIGRAGSCLLFPSGSLSRTTIGQSDWCAHLTQRQLPAHTLCKGRWTWIVGRSKVSRGYVDRSMLSYPLLRFIEHAHSRGTPLYAVELYAICVDNRWRHPPFRSAVHPRAINPPTAPAGSDLAPLKPAVHGAAHELLEEMVAAAADLANRFARGRKESILRVRCCGRAFLPPYR